MSVPIPVQADPGFRTANASTTIAASTGTAATAVEAFTLPTPLGGGQGAFGTVTLTNGAGDLAYLDFRRGAGSAPPAIWMAGSSTVNDFATLGEDYTWAAPAPAFPLAANATLKLKIRLDFGILTIYAGSVAGTTLAVQVDYPTATSNVRDEI